MIIKLKSVWFGRRFRGRAFSLTSSKCINPFYKPLDKWASMLYLNVNEKKKEIYFALMGYLETE